MGAAPIFDRKWEVQDLNLRRHVPPDLQSGSFNHSDNLPSETDRT